MIEKSFVIKPEYFEIRRIRNAFREIALKSELERDNVSCFEVVIGEVLANAMEHGLKMNKEKEINFNMNVTKSQVMFEISYDGTIIKKDDLEKYIKEPNLNDDDFVSENGRGIFLIHKIMDKVEYFDNSDNVKIILEKSFNY